MSLSRRVITIITQVIFKKIKDETIKLFCESGYCTAPLRSKSIPGGIPYIVSNEAAERFSFYGMKGILIIFMTKYLKDATGSLNTMNPEEAKYWFHLFTSGVYFFPILGAVISDLFFGKYRTIIFLSIIYCLGHLALSIDDTKFGLALGLILIAIGSGGIKPCVSAHVGDQFGLTNHHLLEKVFSWFYFAINFGAFLSVMITPYLLSVYGPNIAFSVPGVLMLLATIVFWMGRNKFVHIPPGGKEFLKELFSPEGIKAIGKLSIVFVFVSVFFSLYDQTGSSWVLQAEKMDRIVFGIEWLPSQVQSVNPILIMIFIPLFSYLVYPAVNKYFRLNSMRKISIGLFLTVIAFLIPAWIENRIAAGLKPGIEWQLLAYVLITAAEVLVSITCLEFAYTQAPKKLKSVIMALFLLSISMGNAFTSLVNLYIQKEDGTSILEGADYYLFFAGVMLVTSILFIIVAVIYKERIYIHDET